MVRFQDLPLPVMLFRTSHFYCTSVYLMLLLASMCSNPILKVLFLDSIFVLFQPLCKISARFSNIHLVTLTAGDLVHITFHLLLFHYCLHPHQRLSKLLSWLEDSLYTQLLIHSFNFLTYPLDKRQAKDLGPIVVIRVTIIFILRTIQWCLW